MSPGPWETRAGSGAWGSRPRLGLSAGSKMHSVRGSPGGWRSRSCQALPAPRVTASRAEASTIIWRQGSLLQHPRALPSRSRRVQEGFTGYGAPSLCLPNSTVHGTRTPGVSSWPWQVLWTGAKGLSSPNSAFATIQDTTPRYRELLTPSLHQHKPAACPARGTCHVSSMRRACGSWRSLGPGRWTRVMD